MQFREARSKDEFTIGWVADQEWYFELPYPSNSAIEYSKVYYLGFLVVLCLSDPQHPAALCNALFNARSHAKKLSSQPATKCPLNVQSHFLRYSSRISRIRFLILGSTLTFSARANAWSKSMASLASSAKSWPRAKSVPAPTSAR
jgi:hypothetical protein